MAVPEQLKDYTELSPDYPSEHWLSVKGMYIYRQSEGVVYRIFEKAKEYMIVPPDSRSMHWINIVGGWYEQARKTT